MTEEMETTPKVTLTVSCPLDLYVWLKRTQRNVSAYVVQAIKAMQITQDNEGVHDHEDR